VIHPSPERAAREGEVPVAVVEGALHREAGGDLAAVEVVLAAALYSLQLDHPEKERR
jgi:hypothetical protein